MRPRGVLVLLALILFATLMFGMGAAVERSSADTISTAAHRETAGGESGGESSAQVHSETANNREGVFGFNTESTPAIAAAIVGSLAALGAVWLYWRHGLVLWAAGAIMAGFAVFDIVEIAHQAVEGHATLVALAGVVALLHIAAAVTAVRLATAGPPMEVAAAA